MPPERLAILQNDIVASLPWQERRLARAGERVYAMDATNQPKDGKIKWWIRPEDEDSEWNQDSHGDECGYGVAAWEGDLVFVEDE